MKNKYILRRRGSNMNQKNKTRFPEISHQCCRLEPENEQQHTFSLNCGVHHVVRFTHVQSGGPLNSSEPEPCYSSQVQNGGDMPPYLLVQVLLESQRWSQLSPYRVHFSLYLMCSPQKVLPQWRLQAVFGKEVLQNLKKKR